MKSHMNNLRSILDSLLTYLDDDRFILLLILRIVMNEFICFVCVHKIKEHPAKNQSVSSCLKCLKFLLLLDECLSAFFHMSKTRFKRFSQQLNGIICITAHIIYTFFLNCIRQVDEFILLFFFQLRLRESGHLSGVDMVLLSPKLLSRQ